MSKELERTKMIIAAQIGLVEAGSLWEQLDAKGKYENTITTLKNFFLAHSLLKPTVIELEDGHWIDNDSIALLTALTHNIAAFPILLVVTSRCRDDGTKPDFKLIGVPTLALDLNYLSSTDVRQVAELELTGAVSDDLLALLMEKTNGNPFFLQQLLRYFVERQIIAIQDRVWCLSVALPPLPDTIQAILIARIDRLAEDVKTAVKTAAVIGRTFEIDLLSSILKQDTDTLVQLARRTPIWKEIQELIYIFQHALLRDAAYEMQLASRLRDLHQLVAETMEIFYGDQLAKHYADVAFHYEKANLRDKAIEYLRKAGDAAKAQYHNQQALNLYDRLLVQLRNTFGFTALEIDALLQKAEILELIGEWQTYQQVCEEALRLAEQIDDKRRMGQANLMLGIISRRIGAYETAISRFIEAGELFEMLDERAGRENVLRNLGLINWQKKQYTTAMMYYKKALRLSEEENDVLGIAKNACNIGIIYNESGDNPNAMIWYQKSLQIFEEQREKLNRSRVLNNIGVIYESQGEYKTAMNYYEQALVIAEELGDLLQMTTDIGNIGLIHKLQSNYSLAITYFDRAIEIGRGLDSKYYL